MVTKEIKNADGSVHTVGQVAWIPVNDAAKATERAREAMELGAYKPGDPNEVDNMKKVLKTREREDARKRGLL
jgi:hypothetical protein